jgi:hypothetical protein
MPAAPAAKPFAVQEVGARELHPYTGPAERLDRLAIERLGGFPLGHQRSGAGLDPERPVGATGRGRLRKPAEGIDRELGLAAAGGRLDQLDQSPIVPPRGVCVFGSLVHGGERLLVAAQAVVEHGGHPVHESQPLSVAATGELPCGGVDQWGGLGFAALEGDVCEPDVRCQAGARRLVDRCHLVEQRKRHG